ncbi:toxin Bro [Ruminococcus sp. OA3]|uniref:BRO-N domain-containing protein n=1 Tax=Ruminococcus sp. OA3 TaxID=2914164 RepID=UPI001F05945B|nr:toxin Bro [Ruminococcus sp. OA3]MCH1982462.1 toxin Bro [Ruminococcus sp. OA3]
MNKNEISIFKNPELGIQVRVMENEDGSISINAEDTARGFGWTTVAKSGNEVVRWARVNEYCKELGFSQEVGKDDYIPEALFYRLGMKASNAAAENYQNWLAFDVIPSIRKTGSYSMPKKPRQPKIESLPSATNAVKTLMPLMEKAGFSNEIQLLTAKTLYCKAGCELPFEIQTEQPYYDTVHIAREIGIFTKTGKPASDAVGNIIKKLDINDSEYIETLESKGNWQGSVKKYVPSVTEKVLEWLKEHDYPEDIPYTERSGKEKSNHVVYRLKKLLTD